jgi:hypothetical protein
VARVRDQLLDHLLRPRIIALAEMVVADTPLGINEILGGPVLVVEGTPDRVVAVDRDRIGDLQILYRLADIAHVLLESEFVGLDRPAAPDRRQGRDDREGDGHAEEQRQAARHEGSVGPGKDEWQNRQDAGAEDRQHAAEIGHKKQDHRRPRIDGSRPCLVGLNDALIGLRTTTL